MLAHVNVVDFAWLIIDVAVKVLTIIGDALDPEMLDFVAVDKSLFDLEDGVAVLFGLPRCHKKAERSLRVFDRAIHLFIIVRDVGITALAGRWCLAAGSLPGVLLRRRNSSD